MCCVQALAQLMSGCHSAVSVHVARCCWATRPAPGATDSHLGFFLMFSLPALEHAGCQCNTGLTERRRPKTIGSALTMNTASHSIFAAAACQAGKEARSRMGLGAPIDHFDHSPCRLCAALAVAHVKVTCKSPKIRPDTAPPPAASPSVTESKVCIDVGVISVHM